MARTIIGGLMATSMHSKILWRMAGRAVEDSDDDQPQTAGRALRLAVARVANNTVGLVLTVTGVAGETLPLDGMLDGLGSDLMLVALHRDGKMIGLIALDTQFRAAVLEMQTVGAVIAAAAEERPGTSTDKIMCEPLIDGLLDAMPPAMVGGQLEGWIDRCREGNRINSARAAGLLLADCNYRVMRITVDLGVADRQGLILVALPPLPQMAVPTADPVETQDWGSQFRQIVSDSPATLSAQLHRFKIPLAQARALEVGHVLPLTGCNVHSVRLLSPTGQKVAQAKLGQLGGMRAVRVESAPKPQMTDLSGVGAALSDGMGGDPGMLALGADDPMMADDMPGAADFSGMAESGDFGGIADENDLGGGDFVGGDFGGTPMGLDGDGTAGVGDDASAGLGDEFPMAPLDMDSLGN